MLLARVYVRHQRDLLMQEAVKVMTSHTRRVGLGLAGTLTFDEVCEVRDYIAKLCDVPQQKGFPYDVQWPKTPGALRKNIVG